MLVFPHETPRTGLAALTGRGFLLEFPNEAPRDPVSAGYIETSVCSIVKFNWQNIVKSRRNCRRRGKLKGVKHDVIRVGFNIK